MLRSLAVFSMQGRWQSAIAIALLTLIPFLSYFANGVIALCTLRMGPKEGIKVVLATTVLFTLLAGLLLDKLHYAGLFLLSNWVPVLVVSLVLGYTRSLALALLTASGLGIMFVIGTYLFMADPALVWQEVVSPFMALLAEQPGWTLSATETQSLIVDLSGVMTGFLAAGLSLNAMLGLLLGRAWQAELYNPGGFASEFTELQLGKPAALVAVFIMAITALPLGGMSELMQNLVPVVLVVFVVQALSVVHSIIRQKQMQSFWLVAVYILIVVLPQILAFLAVLGVLEQWFNFRQIQKSRINDE